VQVLTEGFKEMAHGLKGIHIEVGSHLFPQQALAAPFRPRRLEQRTTQLLDVIHQKRQHHQRGKHHREVLIAVAKVVFERIALILQGVERFIFDAPASPRPPHALIHRAFVDPQIGDPAPMLDWAVSRRLPALDEIDPQVWMGGIERQVRDKTTPMVHFGFAIVTIIGGHTTGSLSLGNLLEQKGVVSFFDPSNVLQVVVLQRLDVGGIRTEALFGDDHLEMRVILTKLGDEALGRVALAIIFLRAVLFDHRLGHEGNDFSSVRVEKRCSKHLMGRGKRAIVGVFFPTRLAVHLLGGKIPRAIEGQQIMALDKHHRCENFATLEPAKPHLKGRAQVPGLNRIEGLTHRRITGDPANAVNARHIVFGPLFVKGEERGRLEGKHGEGGHQGVMQRDVGIALAVRRNLAKDVLNRAQQSIGAQMFSHFGNHDAHRNLQPKMESWMLQEPHVDMAVYESTSGIPR
jgi:hypothetical protein